MATQHFHDLSFKMDTKQRQKTDQSLWKLAETGGFSYIYIQEYSGYFQDIKF